MNKEDKFFLWVTGQTDEFSLVEDLPVVPTPIGQKEREIALKSERQSEVEEKLEAEFNKDD